MSGHHKKQHSGTPFLGDAGYEEAAGSGKAEGEGGSQADSDDRHDSVSGFGAAAKLGSPTAKLGSPSASLYRMAHRGRSE